MKTDKIKKRIIIAGSAVLAALFAVWCFGADYGAAEYFAALVSALIFYLVCLRFVPVWVDSWQREEELCAPPETEKGMGVRVFLAFLLWDIVIILAVYVLRFILGYKESFVQYLDFWTCTDSKHYLDIARDWYLSEGELDRLVQLVFLPGYPLAVRAVNAIVGNLLISGLLVSALCFSGAGCVFYKLLRLDFPHNTAVRALIYLCISPAVFFFAAPMSDSMFLLLSLGCIYLMRRSKFLPACALGALASFTRSLGIVLIVPALFELISKRAKARDFACLLIIPLGFAAYCLINYQVAGDAFKFMEYQSGHWNQHLGFFWNTAAYQTDYLIGSIGTDLADTLGLWIPNLLASFGALVIMALAAKKLRPSYTAYFIAYFTVAIGATWLLSAPRYLASAFMLYIALAQLIKKQKTDILLRSASAVLLVCYLCAFALRWQVW